MRKLLTITTISASLPGTLTQIFRPLREHGWRIDAMANGAATDSRCAAKYDQVFHADLFRNPLDFRNLTRAPAQICAVVARGAYDVVHVHTPVAAFVARYALRSLPREIRPPVIYTAHGFHFFKGNHPLKNLAFRTLEKVAGPWTDYLVVINDEDYQAAQKYRFLPDDRTLLIPGLGVDFARFRRDANPVDAIHKELGLSPEIPLFLCIAEFSPGKRQADLLRAFAATKRQDIHLLLAGEGALKDDCRRLASRLGIETRVHFLGFRSDVPALLAASRATILCSGREGLPLAVLEAQAMGVPVIGTDVRGTPQLARGRRRDPGTGRRDRGTQRSD